MNKLAVAVLGVAAAGCSSSKAGFVVDYRPRQSVHRSTATSSPPSSSASSSTLSSTAGSASLAGIVLKPSDLPTGWTATPHQADPNDKALAAALAKCAGGRNTAADMGSHANSPDSGLNGASVSSSASSYKTTADIAADIAIVAQPQDLQLL